MGEIVRARDVLPRWLCFALPGALLPLPYTPPVLAPLVALRAALVAQCGLTAEGARGAFITGGAVCSTLYARDWHYCDIDVTVSAAHCSARRSLALEGAPRYIDMFAAREGDSAEQSIERFDLSCVQQGYGARGWFATPLSLYTYATHTLVALPDRGYARVPGDDEAWRLGVLPLVARHDAACGLALHTCLPCQRPLDAGFCAWLHRLFKYAARFAHWGAPLYYRLRAEDG